jgi:hypothetical protein
MFPSNEVKPAEAEAALPPLKKQVTLVTLFVLFIFAFKRTILDLQLIPALELVGYVPGNIQVKTKFGTVKNVNVTDRCICSCQIGQVHQRITESTILFRIYNITVLGCTTM